MLVKLFFQLGYLEKSSIKLNKLVKLLSFNTLFTVSQELSSPVTLEGSRPTDAVFCKTVKNEQDTAVQYCIGPTVYSQSLVTTV